MMPELFYILVLFLSLYEFPKHVLTWCPQHCSVPPCHPACGLSAGCHRCKGAGDTLGTGSAPLGAETIPCGAVWVPLRQHHAPPAGWWCFKALGTEGRSPQGLQPHFFPCHKLQV